MQFTHALRKHKLDNFQAKQTSIPTNSQRRLTKFVFRLPLHPSAYGVLKFPVNVYKKNYGKLAKTISETYPKLPKTTKNYLKTTKNCPKLPKTT